MQAPFFGDLEQELGEFDNCWVSVSDIREFLGLQMKDWYGDRDMGRAMRQLGWEKKTRNHGGKQKKVYCKGCADIRLKLLPGDEPTKFGTGGRFEPEPNVTQSKLM